VVFANGERLYEKREPVGVKMRLRGERYFLYRGLDREDSTVIGRHDPFLFFEFALVTPTPSTAHRSAPDSMALDGWQYHCPPSCVDVRSNHRPVPAGVTLGDVRRGWKGSCD
jgi:hypothetical protein